MTVLIIQPNKKLFSERNRIPNLSFWMRIPCYRDNDLQSEDCIPILLWNRSNEYYKVLLEVLLLKLQICCYFILLLQFLFKYRSIFLLFLLLSLLLFILFLCFHSPFHTVTSSPSFSMDAVQKIWVFCGYSTRISFLWDPHPTP